MRAYGKWCDRCGLDLLEAIGLCGRCAGVLGIDLTVRRTKVAKNLGRRVRNKQAACVATQRYEDAHREKVVSRKKERAARRAMDVFPRASEVTVTHADGSIEIVAAYETPGQLRKVAPERLPIPDVLRSKVFHRDYGACRYCGNDVGPFEIDHVVPVSKGGRTAIGNLVTACKTCNQSKGDATWRPNPLPKSDPAA